MRRTADPYRRLKREMAQLGFEPGPMRWMLVGDLIDEVEQATRAPCRGCGSRRLRVRCFHRRNVLRTFAVCLSCSTVDEKWRHGVAASRPPPSPPDPW